MSIVQGKRREIINNPQFYFTDMRKEGLTALLIASAIVSSDHNSYSFALINNILSQLHKRV